MSRKTLLQWLVLVLVLAVPVYGMPPEINTVDIRYRVTVRLAVEGKEAQGSAIWQVHVLQSPVVSNLVLQVLSEAVQVPLTDGSTIFMLPRQFGKFSGRENGAYPVRCVDRGAGTKAIVDALKIFGGPCDMTVFKFWPLPTLVKFADPQSASTLEVIDYQVLKRPASECAAVCMLSLVIERTSDPVTTGLAKVLPWITMGQAMSPIGSGEQVDPDLEGFGRGGVFYNQDFSTVYWWSGRP